MELKEASEPVELPEFLLSRLRPLPRDGDLSLSLAPEGLVVVANDGRRLHTRFIEMANPGKWPESGIVVEPSSIKELIKDGQLKKAERRAITILRNWK